MPDAAINESLLEARLTRREEARQWSPRVVSRLEMFIRSADAGRHPGIDALLAGHEVAQGAVSVKGVSGKLRVYRVTLPEA